MGIESVETDLGEYIQQLDGEPPYHIVTPAMHKSKEDVAKLFAEKLGTDPNLTPEAINAGGKEKLREKYITGGSRCYRRKFYNCRYRRYCRYRK